MILIYSFESKLPKCILKYSDKYRTSNLEVKNACSYIKKINPNNYDDQQTVIIKLFFDR